MAAEERARIEFSYILGRIGRRHEIIQVKWTDNKLFEIKFRTQIPNDSEDFNALCDEWVDQFSEVTNTVWAKKISNTGPKIRFRKQYQCWTHGGKVIQKELLFDARRCKGTLDMKVLTDNPFTRRKNKHIRLGLNVVVKINFVHLHTVDLSEPDAFFVHECKPLPEPPKPQILQNDRLPQLVAEMVRKGRNASPKVVNVMNNTQPEEINTSSNEEKSLPVIANIIQVLEEKQIESQLLQDNIQLSAMQPESVVSNIQEQNIPPMQQQQQTIQLVQNVPIQNMETIKFELPSHLQQYTQVVVSDLPEPLLMCQSLMFDTSQVIPVTAHTLSPHFVQIHSQNLHNQ